MTRAGVVTVVALLIAMLLVGGTAPEAAPPIPIHSITAHEVTGVSVGPGKKLWVFVFPEKPEHGKGKPSRGTVCTLDGNQTSSASLGFYLPGVVPFNINPGSIPLPDKGAAIGAIRDSFGAWEQAAGKTLFAINEVGGASSPAQDGNNTVGWAYLAPRSTLAATWVWTTEIDGVDYVTDVDIFYNLHHQWGVFDTCASTETRYEVGNVGTHEVGHAIGLAHVSDAGAMATMYPSASKGEVKKQTLTVGDTEGAASQTAHILLP